MEIEGKITTELYLTEEYQEADVQYIINQIDSHNLSVAPTAQNPPSELINLLLKDRDGQIFGGLLGRSYRFALYIHVLWISERVRGVGYGSRLLKK
jgi:hypothetical protein